MGLRTGLAVLILAPEAYVPLRAVGAQFHASMDGLTAAERIFAVLETPLPRRGTRCDIPSPARASIELRGVRVCFADRESDALRCPDVVIRPGRVAVIIAPSGAGKTTLLHLLAGLLQPDAGVVSVGDTTLDGVDLADVDPITWRTRTGYLGQRPRLVAGTVLDNLRLGNPAVTDQEIADALARAAGDAIVDALPAGLATDVGEGGALLSAGQRQRLALTRALLRDAPLLLLDEPTSALDTDTERRVLTGLAQH